jgi:hypothetical protein
VLLRDERDRDNVVHLHIIICRNYLTGIMILCNVSIHYIMPIVQLRYIGSYVILGNECDLDNVVPLHIIVCGNYTTGIMILCYIYTLHNVQSTLSYITLCNVVHYSFCHQYEKIECALCFVGRVPSCNCAISVATCY